MMKPTRPHIRRGGPYPQEFREEAVRYWQPSGQPLASVAGDLGLTPEALRSLRRRMETESSQTPSVTSAIGSAASQELALARA